MSKKSLHTHFKGYYPEFFVLAAEASPLRQEDSGAGFTKTGLARAAFERTARRLPRECRQAGGRSVVPKRLPVRRSRHEREQPGRPKNPLKNQQSRPKPGAGASSRPNVRRLPPVLHGP